MKSSTVNQYTLINDRGNCKKGRFLMGGSHFYKFQNPIATHWVLFFKRNGQLPKTRPVKWIDVKLAPKR
jgi:hypothetical protein